MRPLRYAINVTLDGCVHHEAGVAPDGVPNRSKCGCKIWSADVDDLAAQGRWILDRRPGRR